MNKILFEKPKAQIIKIENDDIIVCSGTEPSKSSVDPTYNGSEHEYDF